VFCLFEGLLHLIFALQLSRIAVGIGDGAGLLIILLGS
jgi:hypothetical protein